MEITIGTQFKTRGKHPRLCTVVDILTITNSAGKVVDVRYVATHEFLGQTVTDYNVTRTGILMGMAALAA